MDVEVQEAVSENATEATHDGHQHGRDSSRSFTLGPRDSLEGKLTYEGHMQVEGRAEGEFRVTGNIDVSAGATVKALLEANSVNLRGEVEGTVNARDKLTLGKTGRLRADIQVRRLQIEDGASLNGYVRMGDLEQPSGG